jgi:hypothetical protein
MSTDAPTARTPAPGSAALDAARVKAGSAAAAASARAGGAARAARSAATRPLAYVPGTVTRARV